MKMIKYLTINILLCLFMACNGDRASSRKFSIVFDKGQDKFQYGQFITANIESRKKTEIDSVVYSISGNLLGMRDGRISLEGVRLGHRTLDATVYFQGKEERISKKITVLADSAPVMYGYTIVNEYPHDSKAFTQGLEFYGDTLYESTGRRGHSSLRKLDYRSGNILKKIALEETYFGEGLTILNDRIYQLTWRSDKGFVYDMDFNRLREFPYNQSKEGWGLCNDGTRIFKSDGTEKIWILDPETLEETGHIETVTNTSVFSRANELEYANGSIYANTWQKDGVMIINPETGAIEGVVDLRGLKDKVTQHNDLDVLNGIAYHHERGTFFITGKNWDKLFEITIVKKQDQSPAN